MFISTSITRAKQEFSGPICRSYSSAIPASACRRTSSRKHSSRSSRRRRWARTGLGLSQVYGFIKQSGGHVKIYSEVGEGTTVKLYLPRLMIGGRGAAEGGGRAVPLPRHGETILVVEDDADMRATTVEMIRELGYRVIEAPDGGRPRLRLLDAHRDIALLFTDVGLPGGMNGRQLSDEARRRRPALKVLFTSGYARNAIVHHGRLDPGVELLPKPFTYAGLATRIRQSLHSA